MNSESLSSSSDQSSADTPASDAKSHHSSKHNSGNGYVSNVDELINRTPLSLVLQHYGLPQPQNSNGMRFVLKVDITLRVMNGEASVMRTASLGE